MQHSDIIAGLEQIGRTRALTAAESAEMERCIKAIQRAERRTTCVTRRAMVPAWYHPWDEQTDAQILKSKQAGIRAIDIAMTIGRTPSAVYERLSQLRKLTGANMRDGRQRIRGREA